jgi:retron-type reverse transcriptase
MSRLASLKSTRSLKDVANLLQLKPAALAYILFKLAPAAKYTTFEIPKRKGGTRAIKAPTDKLKLVQEKLSVLLQDCLDELNEAKTRQNLIAHGFRRKRSIITNARQHRNRRYVFNIDLENFFPSINFGRVRGYFIRDKSFELDEDVATVIAQIACHENALPQGSPCSPVISNLIAHVLDIHLVRLVSKVGCTYSRYADDLTFSTNKKDFPVEIARPSETDLHVWVPGRELQRLIAHSGFSINPAKTHMQYRDSGQDVTGLVVNQRINARHEYRHNVRAMVHSLFSKGSFMLYGPVQKDGVVTIETRPGTLNELHGRLGFIDSIDLDNKRHAAEPKHAAPISNESMYRQFLIYKDFYTAEAPVVMCEGKTDNTYLTHAIRALAADFPELAEIAADGKIRIKVRLYKYPKSSSARILGLHDGGNAPLSSFIATYKRDTDKFKAPGLKSPVIVLYDNDSGSKKIHGVVKEAAKITVTGSEPYIHIVKNLYAVPTPLLNGATSSKIEDFFDATIKGTVLGGKTFNDNNTFDTAKHYGKSIFAEQVVRVKANSIDFSGFRTLLAVLESVIRAHSAAVYGIAAQ